jgi:hypothetical protein
MGELARRRRRRKLRKSAGYDVRPKNIVTQQSLLALGGGKHFLIYPQVTRGTIKPYQEKTLVGTHSHTGDTVWYLTRLV